MSNANKYLMLVLFVTISLVSVEAEAGPPELFASCPNADLSKSQSIVVFDKECSTGFVLPSASGVLKVSAATINVSEAQCAEIESIRKSSLGEFGSEAERIQKRAELVTSVGDLRERLEEIQTETNSIKLAQAQLINQVSAYNKQIEEAKREFENNCASDAKTFACVDLENTIADNEDKLSEKEQKLTAVGSFLQVRDDEVSSLDQRITKLEADIDAIDTENFDPDAIAQASELLAKLRSESGATISVSLKSTIIDDVRALQQANVQSGVAFSAMPILSGTLHAADANVEEPPELLGAIRLTVPGRTSEDFADATEFVNAAAAKLELDNVAACRAFAGDIPKSSDLSKISSLLAANVVAKAYVDYSVIATAKITVEMDYEKFYQFVIQKSSSNGFFKTSTSSTVSEELGAQNILKVEVENVANALTQEQIDALEDAMRDRTVQRALSFLEPKYVGVNPNATTGSTQAGATVAAKELRKCPNVYCQVGAAVLDVAHAIFGGSSSSQSFVQQLNVNSVEIYESGQAFELASDMVFEVGN